MNTLTKRTLSFILVFFTALTLLPQQVPAARADTAATVFEYTSMLEDNGSIYYIASAQGTKESYDIYRLEIANGNKTKLLTSDNYISNLLLHKDTLYYTSDAMSKEGYQTYSVTIATQEKKTVCTGYLVSLDDSSLYYTVTKGEKCKLYKKDYNSKKSLLIYTGNTTLSFVKNLDGTLYFSQFNEATSKLVLYMLQPGQTKLTALTTDKLAMNETGQTTPIVSDIISLNGDLYYQYGTHQGSGSFWYGTLKKISTSGNKKSVIVKELYEEQIYHNTDSIFYCGIESSEKSYIYHIKTGKTSSYACKITGTESYNILGDKTYCAVADGKASITVAAFTSGTNKKNLVKDFITISYKQDKSLSYSASVKQLGDYLLIPVQCMDYNDASYGWRGKCVSITWYVADLDGKSLATFQ